MPPAPSPSALEDTPAAYGRVTRVLHWGMAVLLAWMFLTATARALFWDVPLVRSLWWTHASTGFLVFILALVRVSWAVANRHRRPPKDPSLLGRLATLGHGLLYTLMLVIPALGLLRAYGFGRGFAPFGLPLFPPLPERIPALMAPANAVHGLLGWCLLALVAGHVAMALVHAFAWRDGLLARMAGRRPRLALAGQEAR
ncbi:cytochrome b [Roseomonas sp. OT10]|uniref:cytochrome b n=1 Tax=Roseomonas cutis TaxID=2897332 RepID=UPI001E3EEBC2|nr:cytochrome b [Roseomonas sp. OT10]UFN50380.1 cytochrome b [Roseomonas sp. OT10]